MNKAQCHIILCYFSDGVAIVFVNTCLTQDDGQPLGIDDIVIVLLLSGQIITLLTGECV